MQGEISPGLVGYSPILAVCPSRLLSFSWPWFLVLWNKGVGQDNLLGLSTLTFCNWQVLCMCGLFLLLDRSVVVHYCGCFNWSLHSPRAALVWPDPCSHSTQRLALSRPTVRTSFVWTQLAAVCSPLPSWPYPPWTQPMVPVLVPVCDSVVTGRRGPWFFLLGSGWAAGQSTHQWV